MKTAFAAAALLLALWTPAQAAAPQRVASVFLCTDEYLFRLLPRARIAALSFLAADRNPVVSTISDAVEGVKLIPMSAEAVLSARPDAVVLAEGTSTGVRAVLKAARIPIIDVPWPNSLADIRRITLRLAEQLGVPQQGRSLLADMDRRLAQLRRVAPNPRVTVLIYEPNGYTVSGGVTEELLSAAGLRNAAPALRPTRQGTIPVETVVARAPELLVFNGTAERVDSRARQMLGHPALSDLRRTEARWISLTGLLCPGPWSVGAAEELAGAAHAARARSDKP